MDFSDSLFWCLLVCSLPILCLGNLLFRAAQEQRRCFQQLFIVALSLTMLGSTGRETLAVFLSVTLLAYAVCQGAVLTSERCRKIILGGLIPLLLLPLIYYKYSYFLACEVLHQEWDTLRGLVIPIGLSFYTFQTIAFCIDTLLRGMPIPNLREYMVFCSFFPQIVAGPIERRSDLLPQVQGLNLRSFVRRINIGMRYVILGLFFKVFLADNLAQVFVPDYQGEDAWIVWANNLLFAFRIYFDFAGYGLTAYGLARCFGIRLQMNFLSPYTATHIGDFWRRWHRSLTGWFRDYIYFPLGGSRTRFWAVNMLLVFTVSGLWHGAGWNFLIWGGLSGLALVIHRCWRRVLRMPAMPGIVGWALTTLYMVLIWMFFYDTNPENLLHHCQTIFTPRCYELAETASPEVMKQTPCIIFLLCAALVIAMEWFSSRKGKTPYGIFLRDIPCTVMFFLTLLFAPSVPSQFIYFTF